MSNESQRYETTFPAVFACNVATHPDRPAVITTGQSVTYAELNAQANSIAAPLFARPDNGAEPICLLFGQEIAAFAATIAVLKSGNFYVTLDPLYPPARLAEMLADTGACLLITNRNHLDLARQLCQDIVTLVNVDELPTHSTPWPCRTIAPDAYAYIGYTSGSTGKAKGVIETHRNHICHWQNLMRAQPDYGQARVLFLNRLSFSGGQLAFYLTFLAGATLYLYDLHRNDLVALPAWIQQHQITVWNSVPSVFRAFVAHVTAPEQVASIRLLRLASDTVLPQDIAAYRRLFGPDCQLWFCYALTEAKTVTLNFLARTANFDPTEIPNGPPLDGMAIWIVDEAGQRLGPDQVGEIIVRSRYVSPGYWRDPALTAARFRPDPNEPGIWLVQTGDLGKLDAAGHLIHKGRKDTQVKVRGYRVELSEIEAQLTRLEGVTAAAVRAFPFAGGDVRLAAYLVSAHCPPPTSSQLRHLLSQHLPDYMIPATFTRLEQMPVNHNGKLDRAALPLPTGTRPGLITPFVPPHTELEQRLAALWADLLDLDAVGVNDNFFELGGHSLLAVRLLVQVKQQFEQALTLRQFIFNPTIAHLASLLGKPQALKAQGASSAGAPDGTTGDPALRFLYDLLEDPGQLEQLRKNAQPLKLRARLVTKLLRLSQPVTTQLLAWLLQQPWVQQRFLAQQTALIQQFLAEVGLQQASQDLVVRGLLFGYLSYLAERDTTCLQAKQTIPVEGLDRLAAARSRGQGVILLMNHTSYTPYLRALKLAQWHIVALTSLVDQIQFDKRKAEQILYARQLELAYEILQQGGVVSIAPDVNYGDGPQITLPFYGRMYQFHTSFAELALLTNAQIFWLAGEPTRHNQWRFRLIGPFDAGDTALTHEERVRRLIEQYVGQLQRQWAKTPWAVPWWLMKAHLAYPRATRAPQFIPRETSGAFAPLHQLSWQ